MNIDRVENEEPAFEFTIQFHAFYAPELNLLEIPNSEKSTP
ncbi:hypothetical protein ACTWP4_17635 [Gracilibacillus sp. D59]